MNSAQAADLLKMLMTTAVTLAASIAVLVGVGAQEAFELLLIWAFGGLH